MFKKLLNCIYFIVVFLTAVMFFAANAKAQEQVGEKAFIISAFDADLEWGACPDFMPTGCQIAILHGNPEDSNADVFFKVPGNSKISFHRHSSQERMILISGELEVRYKGQEAEILKVGNYAFGPAQLPHDAYCKEGDPCILYIGFVGPIDAMPVEED